MWWSAPVSERPVIVQEPGDAVDRLLRELGLHDHDGLWTDAARTVGVARSPGGLFIGWLDVGWIAPGDPFAEMRDVAHTVERVPSATLARDLCFALEEARRLRTERLRDCERCQERFLPGQMLGAACCHGCAARSTEVGA